MPASPPQYPRRIAPVAPADFHPDVRAALGGDGGRPAEFGEGEVPVFDLFKVLANHPKAMKRLGVWGNHVLLKSSLPARDREILILRAGWLCQARYEWAHHGQIGVELAGLTQADIAAIAEGPSAAHWSAHEAALVQLADDLVTSHVAGDAAWTALSATFTTQQMMDAVLTVGNYTMMSMALNSFGVQLEDAYEKWAPPG
jgi:4-carboxymuconolactone decarboxylase